MEFSRLKLKNIFKTKTNIQSIFMEIENNITIIGDIQEDIIKWFRKNAIDSF